MFKFALTSRVSHVLLAISWLMSSCRTWAIEVGQSSNDDIVGGYSGFNDVSEMPLARSDMSAVQFYPNETFGQARVYLFGGCIADQYCTTNLTTGNRVCICDTITSSCNYYLPEVDVWKSDCAPAPTPRYRHAWAKINGLVYLAGGRDVMDNLIQSIDVYNPVTNTWSQDNITWPEATSDLVAFGHGNYLYLVGGYQYNYTSLATVTKYDTVKKTWDSSVPSMTVSRGDTQILELGAKQYVLGGFHLFGFNSSTDSCNAPTKYVEAFDPLTETWTSIPNMVYGRSDMTAGKIRGMMFAIAGEAIPTDDKTCSQSVAVDTVTRYDDTLKTWVSEESLESNRFRFVGSSYANASLDAIYLFGGQRTFDDACQCFRVLNTTTLYVPTSTVIHHSHIKTLSDSGLAGIIIAGIVVLSGIVACCVVYITRYTYLKRYKKLNEEQQAKADPYAYPNGSASAEEGMAIVPGSTNERQPFDVNGNTHPNSGGAGRL